MLGVRERQRERISKCRCGLQIEKSAYQLNSKALQGDFMDEISREKHGNGPQSVMKNKSCTKLIYAC